MGRHGAKFVQRYFANARHTKHMPARGVRLAILALSLVVVLLAAQFHFCADGPSVTANSHLCPLCTVAGSAIVTPPPSIALVTVARQLALPPRLNSASSTNPRPSSPRAPPSC